MQVKSDCFLSENHPKRKCLDTKLLGMYHAIAHTFLIIQIISIIYYIETML